MQNSFYTEIITEHNIRPLHKHSMPDADFKLEGVNPSCGDEIVLNLKIENDIISDASFEGSGCAISQASADIMIELVKGKHKDEALMLADIFIRMIKKEATEEEIESLEEAAILRDISHMPARVKCAVLGWRTMKEIIEEN